MFSGELLSDKRIRQAVLDDIQKMLNSAKVPAYLKEARLTAMSKTDSQAVRVDQTRPLMILSHNTKIIEKAVKNKIRELGSRLFDTESYQCGFKKGWSTLDNLAMVLNTLMSNSRSKNKAKVFISVDLS
jgi:hypothetical protein